MMKIWENNRTEEIGLVTPTLGKHVVDSLSVSTITAYIRI